MLPGPTLRCTRPGKSITAMSYPILLILHLCGALIFIGVVFFEVVLLSRVRKRVPPDSMRAVELAIAEQARMLMPWVLLVLYSAGVGLAWRYRGALSHPFASVFSTLLTIKIVLALSVLGHFIRAITWAKAARMTASRSRLIHWSVLSHMTAIVLLAKGMFYLG
jgi:hypothetical protein